MENMEKYMYPVYMLTEEYLLEIMLLGLYYEMSVNCNISSLYQYPSCPGCGLLHGYAAIRAILIVYKKIFYNYAHNNFMMSITSYHLQ